MILHRISLIVLLLIFSILSYGQAQNSQKIHLENESIQLELIQQEPGAEQRLDILNAEGILLNSIPLPAEYDPYRFYDYFLDFYTGQHSFIIIKGRYEFYILNICAEKISAPISCRNDGIGIDAQSGVWRKFDILQDGQYLLAYGIDTGLYCYDLKDLLNPKKADRFISDSLQFMGNYTFLDHKMDDVYNLITASASNLEPRITTQLSLIGYRFKQDSSSNVEYKIMDNRYLLLQHIQADGSNKELAIDLQTGKLR